jgi:hypothetical protein
VFGTGPEILPGPLTDTDFCPASMAQDASRPCAGRRFDGKRAAMIDGSGAAKIRIAFEYQNLVAGAGKQRRRRQPAPDPITMASN